LRKAVLVAEVQKQAPTPVRLHPNLSELYRQKVADLHLALADPQIGPEALSLLRSLIERIVVRPLPDGSFELEIVGPLAAMVGLGQSTADNKKAALGAAVFAVDECSVKVVAGARNPQYRTVIRRLPTLSEEVPDHSIRRRFR
jgi:site-specific DNA recombinase